MTLKYEQIASYVDVFAEVSANFTSSLVDELLKVNRDGSAIVTVYKAAYQKALADTVQAIDAARVAGDPILEDAWRKRANKLVEVIDVLSDQNSTALQKIALHDAWMNGSRIAAFGRFIGPLYDTFQVFDAIHSGDAEKAAKASTSIALSTLGAAGGAIIGSAASPLGSVIGAAIGGAALPLAAEAVSERYVYPFSEWLGEHLPEGFWRTMDSLANGAGTARLDLTAAGWINLLLVRMDQTVASQDDRYFDLAANANVGRETVALINALGRVFTPSAPSLAQTATDDQVKSFASQISAAADALAVPFTIRSRVPAPVEARMAFSVLAGLLASSPVVVRGNDSAAQTALDAKLGLAWPTEYAQWQADADAISRGATSWKLHFSDEFLRDRAELLRAAAVANTEETNVITVSTARQSISVPTRYQDRNLDIEILWGATDQPSQRAQVVFGNIGNEQLDGFGREDRLYGGGGNDLVRGQGGHDHLEGNSGNDTLMGGHGSDTLIGGTGNDSLEGGIDNDALEGSAGDDALRGEEGNDRLWGGSGLDVLNGGSGNDMLFGGADSDIYKFDAAWGHDIIDDTAGDGSIDIAGYGVITGSGAKKDTATGSVWVSADKRITYTVVSTGSGQTDLVLRFAGTTTDSLTISNWVSGRLGITLGSSVLPGPAVPGSVFSGDFRKGVGNYVDSNNVLVEYYQLESHVNGHGTRYAGVGSESGAFDVIEGDYLGSNDTIFGLGGNDALSGLTGDDYVDGGIGDDLLFGAAGRDTLVGGAGNDFLLGSGAGLLTFATYLTTPQPTAPGPVHTRGFHWVTYDAGIDSNGFRTYGLIGAQGYAVEDVGNVLDGGAGNDKIEAGTGDDTVYAGADNDSVSGMYGGDLIFGDDGNDMLEGDGPDTPGYLSTTPGAYHGNDTISGGAGNDTLNGNGGNDTLYGGADDDNIWGDDGFTRMTPWVNHGNDFLDGGDGNDELSGAGRDDTLFGGSGNDKLFGDAHQDTLPTIYHGNDYLDGEAGNDQLSGQAGNDTLYGGTGDDSMFGDDELSDVPGAVHGDDHLDGEDGLDYLEGGGGSDTLFGGSGNDFLWGDVSGPGLDAADAGDDYLDGEAGNDGMIGGAGVDTLVGGDGDDQLQGDGDLVAAADQKGDFLEGGAGKDSLYGDGGDDFLDGGTGDDHLDGGDGDDFLDAGDGNDSLLGGKGSDALRGGAGNDALSGGDGADLLEGGAGDDGLIGGAGDDTLVGGTGADYLAGGAGDDVYRFAAGDSAANAIGNTDTVDDAEGTNTIEVESAVPVGVLSAPSSSDFLVVLSTGQQIGVYNGAALQNNRFRFGSAVYTAADLIGEFSDVGASGTDGAGGRHVLGGRGADAVSSMTGNATLSGGRGDDSLTGSGGANTYLYRPGDGRDTIVDTGPKIAGNGTPTPNRLVFQRGIAPADLRLSGVAGALTIHVGASGTDGIVLSGFDHTAVGAVSPIDLFVFDDGTTLTYTQLVARGFDGTAGDDTIAGTAGNDRIAGLDGADRLIGNAGNDTLDGGAGNDTLVGGTGNDVYVFGVGAGQDTIDNTDTTGGRIDVLRLGVAQPSDVTLLADGNDLVLSLRGTTDKVRLSNYFTTSPVQRIEFSGGTVWLPADVAANIPSNLTEAADNVTGTTGNDVLSALGGNDTVRGVAGHDLIDGGAGSDALYGGDGNDTLLGAADNDTLFGDANNDRLEGGAGNDLLYGGTGGDTLLGGEGADQLTGEDGDDSLDGGIGDDTFYGGNGNDTLVGGDGNDYLDDQYGSNLVFGGAGSDRITAGVGDDTLDGGAGNDTLSAGSGTNRLVDGEVMSAGSGNDTYVLTSTGNGLVFINDGGGTGDTLILPSAFLPSSTVVTLVDTGSTGDLTLTAGTTIVQIASFFDSPTAAQRIEFIRFADGTVWQPSDVVARLPISRMSEAADNVTGFRWNDVIRSLGGNDSINAALGDDSVDAGGGQDLVYGMAGNDTVDGGSGGDTVLGGAGNDSILGGADDDSLYGDSNSWVADPSDGNDFLDGGTGADFLDAGGGNDTLVGGAGNDHLYGNLGDDTYRVGRTSGRDTLRVGGGADRIVFDSDVAPADVTLFRDGTDLIVAIGQTQAQVRIWNHAGDPVARMEFTGGIVWDAAAIAARTVSGTANAMTGTAGNDVFVVDHAGDTVTEGASQGTDLIQSSVSYTLPGNVENLTLTGYADINGIGNALANVITGNAGNNVLTGESDTLVGGLGDDVYEVGYGATVVEAAGQGIDLVIGRWSHTLADNVENFRATTTAAFFPLTYTGNALNNVITGSSISNYADVYDGGLGADTLVSGNGYGDFHVDNPGDVIVSTNARVFASTTWTLANGHAELVLTGSAAIGGNGNALANTIDGSANSAANVLMGFTGNDVYRVGAGDTVIEAAGEGIDTVEFNHRPVDGRLSTAPYVGTSVEKFRTAFTLGADLTIVGTDTAEDITYSADSYGGYFPDGRGGMVIGAGGNDTLAGGMGRDTLDGGSGDDLLSGMAGSDSLIGGSGADTLSGAANRDDLRGGAGDDLLDGGDDDDIYRFGIGDGRDVIVEGADDRIGKANELRFDAGIVASGVYVSRAGADLVLDVGGTSDRVVVTGFFTGDDPSNARNPIQRVVFDDGTVWGLGTLRAMANPGIVNSAPVLVTPLPDVALTEGSFLDVVLPAAAFRDFDVGDALAWSAFRSDGSALPAGLHFDAVTRRLTGTAPPGLHDLRITATDYAGATASDVFRLTINVENRTIVGTAGRDVLQGLSGNDTLSGLAGDDEIDGGAGADSMSGGTGNDSYRVDNAGDRVVELAGEGSYDSITSSISYALPADVESLYLTGAALDATGNSLDNVLQGTAGNNRLDGGLGADTMYGNVGNDTFVVDNAGDVLYADNRTDDTDTVESSVTWTLQYDLENLTLTGSSPLNGTGNSSRNVLRGNGGANRLDGASGADTMIGGSGDDTYVVDDLGDTIVELSGGGYDAVESSVSHVLAPEIEKLTLTGSSMQNATGNAIANTLIGNASANVIDGAGGADTMIGGGDSDTYVVDNTGDVVVEVAGGGTADHVRSTASWTLSADVENLTLEGSGNLSATGNALGNTITGNGGANRIDGKGGADTMAGGAGDDTYVVDVAADDIAEFAGGGTDTVEASLSWTLGSELERLLLTGSSGIDGTGNASANTLTGNGGANRLDGRGGADTMVGGAGDDVYVVDAVGDTTTELAGGGTDTVESSIAWTLAADIEKLVLLGGSAIAGTGNAGHNTLIGNAGANTLAGAAGNDTLDGGAVNDALDGGLGDDTYLFALGGGADTVNAFDGTAGRSDSLQLGAGIATGDVALTRLGDDLVVTVRGTTDSVRVRNHFVGNAAAGWQVDRIRFADATVWTVADIQSRLSTNREPTLVAALADQSVPQGQGFTLTVPAGNFIDPDAGDTLSYSATLADGSPLPAWLSFASGSRTFSGSSGSAALGTISVRVTATDPGGLSASDVFDLTVLQPSSTINGTSGNDYLYGSSGNETINGLAGDDTLWGGDGNDALYGNEGNDALGGQGGSDTLSGGAGDDLYYYDAGDLIVEAAGEGTDVVYANADIVLSANVENVYLQGGATRATGNASNNSLVSVSSSFASARLDGGGGVDTMYGGLGNDTFVVDDAGDVIYEYTTVSDGTTVYTNTSIDTVEASASYVLPYNVERLVLVGGQAIDGTGNGLANAITGNGAANRLTGGGGADTLSGGAGNDTYDVLDAAATIVEAAGEGIDTVEARANWTLGANLENLTLLDNAVTGIGNAGANVIRGNALANTLDGGAGADTLIGGAGDDAYIVDSLADVVTEVAGEGNDTMQASFSATIAANVESLVLTGSSGIGGTGDGAANRIVGNSGNNALAGLAGNDTLDGGLGTDTLNGGAGEDTFVVDSVADVVIEAVGEGFDTIQAAFSYALTQANVEGLTLLGSAPIDGTGSTIANVLRGNAGANRLDGGGGADTLIGGAGDDVYIVDDAGDAITELAGEGIDSVFAGASHVLASQVEKLTLTGSVALDGTGNTLANVLVGNSAANVLDGGAGIDTMTGGLGDDTYVVDQLGDVVVENVGEGTDTVRTAVNLVLGANLENLVLVGSASVGTGNALANVLTGNGGANTLDGGLGIDTLAGGAGNDTYIVDDAAEVVVENAGEGTDVVQASVSHALAANVENLVLTGSGHLDATGNAGANALTGNAGSNVLDGLGGNDTMSGGAGDDTYVVDSAGDVVTEGASAGLDTVRSSVSYTLAANVENLVLTTGAAINGTGNALANVLTGNAGNNRLDGGSGVDTMVGGLGDDVYVVDVLADVITEEAGGGTDRVETLLTYTLGSELENLTLLGSGNVNGSGNALANVLTGNAGNNVLTGGTGADTMAGGAGNDTYVVDETADVVTEATSAGTDLVQSSVTYTLSANVENLTLTGSTAIDATGNTLANVLTGNAGNNVLAGGGGSDTMAGGLGDDTYVVDVTTDVVTEAASAGTDTVQSLVSWTLGANVENLTLLGTGSTNATGNTLANVLVGNASANRIDGLGGIDTMVGGAGNDTYVVDNAADVVTELASGGTDTVESSVSYTLATEVEKLLLTSTGNTSATGNALANTLTGNSGNNILNGLAGNDTMVGGAGNDVYVVDATGDVTTELASGGTDRVESTITWTLAAEVENLTLLGSSAINGTGNALGNAIVGNGGDNVLNGGAGSDTLTGGLGNDTYVVDVATDVVTEGASAGVDTVQSLVTWTLGANLENLTLTGSDSVNATGNALANVLTGNAGANVLDGGSGIDTMAGGAGNDTYVVDNAADVVTEAAGAGTDSVTASVSHVLAANVENLTLGGTTAINATGNALANALTGNAGANVLDGLAGSDTMTGGAGNDVYIVDASGDLTVELASGGTDRVESTVSWTLSTEVENLTLLGSSNLNGTGNALGNALVGNAGNNRLDGMAGIDTMTGGAGNDTYVVDVAGDQAIEVAGGGTDTVEASLGWTLGTELENLLLTGSASLNGFGNALANVLTGNGGDNVLDGGAGSDTLIGGLGNDTYVVDAATDVITEAASAGTDLVQSAVTWTLGTNLENLTLSGASAINGTGNTVANALTGNGGANILTGLAGNDTLDGGAGADTLVGGTGNDTYWFGRGYGAELIQDDDTTAGNVDVLRFQAGVTDEQVWFRRLGNDLEISVIGTADKALVQNWYLGSRYQLEEMRLSDGQLLANTRTQTLVDAMASFAPPAIGQTTLPDSYRPSLVPVIASEWTGP